MNCNENKEYLIDYIDKNLNEEDMKKVSIHLEECRECKDELLSIMNMANELETDKNNIDIPPDFMNNIRIKFNKTNIPAAKKRKNIVRIVLVAAAVLVVSMVTVFASEGSLLELLRKISPETRINSMVEKGVGDRLNISKTDKDIKITVTDVAADDIQTLISYKIEDLKSGKEYGVNFIDGIDIKEKWGMAEGTNIQMYNSVFNHEGKGTLTLYPLDTEEKTIHLAFKKLVLNSENSTDTIEGNWNFEVPVKKHHGKTYDINAEVKVDNHNIYFNKITIAPTLTTVSFNFGSSSSSESIIGLQDLGLIINGKELKPYNFGNGNSEPYSLIGFGNDKMTFESIFPEEPKNIEIKVRRLYTQVEDKSGKEFTVDLTKKEPQNFEYLGNKITIDNLKIENNIIFDFNEELLYNRQYERLQYTIIPESGHSSESYFSSMGSYTEFYYVDKNNNKYNYIDAQSNWEKIRTKNPVLYVSKTKYTLKPSEKLDINKMKYFKLSIEGYTKTRFVDKTVKIKLK